MGDRAAAGSRCAYWLPLVLLGFGLLGLLGWDSVAARDDVGWFAYAPPTPVAQSCCGPALLSAGAVWPSPSRDWPWAVLIIVTLVGTAAWYAGRARRAGGAVRPYVALAVGGGLAVPACYVLTGMADAVADPAGLVVSVGLPLLALGVLTGTWAYFRRGRWRRTATAISVACVVAGVATVLGAWWPGGTTMARPNPYYRARSQAGYRAVNDAFTALTAVNDAFPASRHPPDAP